MFLDIIVPHYKEDETLIKRLLESIENQKDVDSNEIRVLLISCPTGYKLSKTFLKGFKINVKEIYYDNHISQGMAEQYGIDISDAKYITFIDSDDELIKDRLHYAIETLKKHDFNMLLSHFIEEVYDGNKMAYYTHKDDLLHFLHGLFLKREYLINNDIRFNPRIKYAEDSYFAKILFMTANCDKPILNVPIYLWKYNKNSVMRESNNLIMKLYNDIFIGTNDAYHFIKERNDSKENNYYLISGFFDLLIKLESNYFDVNLKESKEKELYDMYLNNKDIFELEKDNLDFIYNKQLDINKEIFNDIIVYEDYKSFIKKMEK